MERLCVLFISGFLSTGLLASGSDFGDQSIEAASNMFTPNKPITEELPLPEIVQPPLPMSSSSDDDTSDPNDVSESDQDSDNEAPRQETLLTEDQKSRWPQASASYEDVDTASVEEVPYYTDAEDELDRMIIELHQSIDAIYTQIDHATQSYGIDDGTYDHYSNDVIPFTTQAQSPSAMEEPAQKEDAGNEEDPSVDQNAQDNDTHNAEAYDHMDDDNAREIPQDADDNALSPQMPKQVPLDKQQVKANMPSKINNANSSSPQVASQQTPHSTPKQAQGATQAEQVSNQPYDRYKFRSVEQYRRDQRKRRSKQ